MKRHLQTMLVCCVTSLSLGLLGCTTPADQSLVSTANSGRPNVLFITVDDMGYADLGAFGSEIPTPNLDALAYQGIRLTNFRTSPACSPSRAMLLTGADAHLAGLGNMQEELAPNQRGRPGYEGRLSNRVVTLAELLQSEGYRTYLSGKWHLGSTPDSLPSARGFDRTFALASGGASHFSDMRPAYAPTPEVKAPYYQNGEKLNALPEEFDYSSQFYVDWMISALSSDAEHGDPFFAFLSFTAPHWPLQAPEQALANFRGRYDEGYGVLLKTRFEKQKALGVVPDDVKMNNLPWPSWDTLPPTQQRQSARSMEVYAAMIKEIDDHVGRLIKHLDESNQLANTLIVFLSDNGAEGHTLDETWPKAMFPKVRATIDETHDFSYENMGLERSYTFYNAQWARVSSPTTRWHKGFVSEGGLKSAAFIYYPARLAARIESTPVYIKDLLPTTLALLESSELNSSHPSISGRSIGRKLLDPRVKLAARVEVIELFGKIAVIDFPWKAIRLPAPWQHNTDEWALYNLQTDNLETIDLAASHPETLARLQETWRAYQTRYDVILPDWVSGY